MHTLTAQTRRRAGLLLLAGFLTGSIGCLSVAQHSIKATGRFASAAITSGGNLTGAATSTAIGTAIDVAVGAATKPAAASVVTLIEVPTGIERVVPWKEGLTAYTARRDAALNTAPVAYEVLRGSKTLPAAVGTVLKPGDVLRLLGR